MAAPWFLAALVAIGLPWWLHRLAKAETRAQAFPSTMLLERSDLRDTRQRRLRYLALLALRILLIFALALAFARPHWSSALSALGGKPTVQLIVVDASLSMRMGERWPQAKAQARKLIEAAKDSDRLLLATAAGRGLKVLAGPSAGAERGAVLAALETVEPSLERLDFGAAMSGAKAWKLDGEAGQWPLHLHFISDLQESGSPLRFADLEPPVGAELHVYSVSELVGVAGNAAIAHIELSGGETRALAATVTAFGNTPAATAILIVDGREVGRAAVKALDANAKAIVNFAGLKLTPGAHRLQVQLQSQPQDALGADNHYYAVVEHADPRVLLVTRDPNSDEAAYLASAIEAASAPHLTVVRTLPEQLTAQRLADYAALVVADSGVLSTATAKRIDEHAQAGGNVLVTLGPQALRIGRDPIGGYAVRTDGAREGNIARIGFVEDSHPTLREPQAWRGVRFFKRLLLTPAQSDRVLARFEDGAPLLIERKSEAAKIADGGKVLVLAAPLNRDWNDLAVHPVFVRFIAETARYLAGGHASAASVTVGSIVTTGIAPGAGGQIFDPAGRRALSLDRRDVTHFAPTEAGFYEVRSANGARFIAANVDPRESRLETLPAETRDRWQALARPAEAPPEASAAQTLVVQRDIGRELMILAALLALAELLLANYRLHVIRDA